ncbi:unnamed protein product [Prunus brigantina]
MNESSKRRFMMGLQGKKKKSRQLEADQTLAERLRQLNAGSAQSGAAAAGPSPSRGVPAEGTSSKVTDKRPFTVDLDVEPAPKRGRQTEPARASLLLKTTMRLPTSSLWLVHRRWFNLRTT